jgi:hypothetical protein
LDERRKNMNISKRKQGILAIICTIAMIVTSITVYNPTEVKADPSATVDGKQYSVTVKDGGEWTGFACQGIFDSARIHFAWGIDVDSNTITASIGENNLTVNGKNARGMNIPLSDVTSLEVGSHDIVINATTVAPESAEAKKISATVTLKIEKVEGTTAVKKPSAPVGLVANMNDIKTNYTIAFGNVATATSYKFYLDGTYKKDITNGGIVTIEELGLEAGKTYKFGVSAVNAAGESDITTIDVKVPGKEEETTTGSSTKPLDPSTIKDSEWKLALNSKTVSYYIDGKADKVSVKPQLEGDNYYIAFSLAAKFKSVTFDGVSKDVEEGAFCRVKASDLTSGYHTLVVTDYHGKESVTIYFKVAGEEGTTKYTVSIDGTEKQYKEGATITVPADGQGYYNVTKKEAYAPGTVLAVNENMTLKSIELNVTMTLGASIRLAAPTGLRFQTTVKSGNGIAADEILNSPTVTTGTLITTLDLYTTHGNTLTQDSKKDSTYTVLDIENDGWFNNGTSTETGKFCGSIVKIKAQNYGRAYIAVGYATIKYSDGSSKTVYANVTENNAKSIKYVAEKVQASEKFSGYSAAQKAIINKYINGEEISK